VEKKTILVSFILVVISLVFFHPVFSGKVPFPGDLLVGNHEPYKSYSYRGYQPAGVPHKAQGSDVIRELFPWKFFSIESLKTGQITFWNPYNFSGNPHFANLQSGTFYLVNVLFFLMPFLLGWTIYIILQPILAALFTYIFLRDISLSKTASVYGGITFAFSAFMVVWLQWGVFGHAILWLPLVLFLINRFISKPSSIKMLFLTVVLTQSILAGYIQLAIYLYIFSLSFVLFKFLTEKNKRSCFLIYGSLVFPYIAALILTTFQTLPLIEFVSESLRKPYSLDQLSERLIPLKNLITIIFPDFFGNPATRNYWISGTYIERVSYIGILSILFIFFALYSKSRSKYTLFFIIVSLVSYISALDIQPIKLFHSIGIPALSSGVPSRILAIFCFAVSVLAAIGIDSYIKDENKKRYLKPFFLLLTIVVITWIFVLLGTNENFYITKRNLVLPSLILIFGGFILFLEGLVKKAVVLIFLLTIGDLFYFFHKITPFSPQEYVYPKTEVVAQLRKMQGGNDRYWGYGSAHVDANFQLYEKNFSPEGYDALYIKRYGQLLSASKNGKIADSIPATVAEIAPGYGGDDLKNNYYRQRTLNLLGVKYVLNKNDFLVNSYSTDYDTFPKEIYKLVWQKAPWQIYENKQALPRVFLASDYVVERSNKDKIIQMIFNEKFNLRDKIILEEDIYPKINFAKDENAKVEIKEYKANKIVLQTSAASNMLLFLSDNYYKGWKVSIDGKNDKIYRADYSFRAVPIIKGNHEVVFSYYPESFDLGLKISIGSFISLILLVILFKVKRLHYVKK